jgi:hypothetical protein
MAGGCDQTDVSVTDTADRLRQVRQAYERYLAMAAVDCIMDGTTRNLFSDMTSNRGPDDTDREGADRAASPGKGYPRSDWGFLYRGSVLDD